MKNLGDEAQYIFGRYTPAATRNAALYLMAGVRPVHSSLIAGWFVFIRSDYKLLTDAHFSFKMSLCVHTKYIYFVVAVAFNSTMFPEKIATFLCI